MLERRSKGLEGLELGVERDEMAIDDTMNAIGLFGRYPG